MNNKATLTNGLFEWELNTFKPQKANSYDEYLEYKKQSRYSQLPKTAPEYSGRLKNVYRDMGIGFQERHGWRYYSIILPKGWKIVDSFKYNRELVDNNGATRAVIRFCDDANKKFAHIFFKNRYNAIEVNGDFDFKTKTLDKFYSVMDSKYGVSIFKSNESIDKCNDFLDYYFPNHKDPLNYWNNDLDIK